MFSKYMRVDIQSLWLFSLSSLHIPLPHLRFLGLSPKQTSAPAPVSGSAFRKTRTKALFKTTWRLHRESHDFYDFIVGMEIRTLFCPFILKSHRLSYSSGNIQHSLLLFPPTGSSSPSRGPVSLHSQITTPRIKPDQIQH